jgi:hypothetical protein
VSCSAGLLLEPRVWTALRQQLLLDVGVLQAAGCMDYSLLLALLPQQSVPQFASLLPCLCVGGWAGGCRGVCVFCAFCVGCDVFFVSGIPRLSLVCVCSTELPTLPVPRLSPYSAVRFRVVEHGAVREGVLLVGIIDLLQVWWCLNLTHNAHHYYSLMLCGA